MGFAIKKPWPFLQPSVRSSSKLVGRRDRGTEFGGNKATWIADTFAALKNHPEIVAFTWLNHDKETDWRIQGSAAAQAAFSAGIRDPR